MVPVDSRRVSRAPRYLGSTRKQDGIFTYRAVTFSGRPFQTVRLTPSCPSLHHLIPLPHSHAAAEPGEVCGPATPPSPCGSDGLGSSDFARHYFRNHGCFLLLRVLRWFTSPGSLRRPMNSDGDSQCLHREGFPIRTSPDHSLLAAP